MLTAAKCEAPPARHENCEKLPKIAKNRMRLWRRGDYGFAVSFLSFFSVRTIYLTNKTQFKRVLKLVFIHSQSSKQQYKSLQIVTLI